MRFRLLTLSVFAAFSPTLFAQTFNEIEQQQNIQEQQRRQQLQQQMQEERDVRLPAPQGVTEFTPATQNPDNSPCFPIHEIDLVGEYADKFGFALKYAQRQSGFQAGACLNADDINRIMTLAQNKVIERGYTTTRILAAPQDLNQGRLQLTLMPGLIKSFQVSEQDREHTHSGRIAA
ncbi:POTRA domain-containing protein, partial [Conchiformibius steedae]